MSPSSANPIFDAFFPSLHKAVRIIQDEPETDAPGLATWMDTITLNEGQPPVPELVIALALSRETAATARELIRKWVVEGFSEEQMGEVIRGAIIPDRLEHVWRWSFGLQMTASGTSPRHFFAP